MKLHLQVAMPACCALAGCHATPPVTRDALVGSYAYQSQDPEGKPTDHEFDHLTLQADGKYDRVQGGSTKAKSEKTGICSSKTETLRKSIWTTRVIPSV